MKKLLVVVPILAVVGLVIGFGAFSSTTYDFSKSVEDGTIKYALLIGQMDHNDSAARTKGVRDKLNTRVEEQYRNNANPNVEPAATGRKLNFDIYDKETYEIIDNVTYGIEEVASKEQKSDSGATWDQATATATCNTWYAKYGSNLSCIVSNNDGMAEGAINACNVIKGIPVFGYDSNPSTLKLIKKGTIAGTINSNAPTQCAAIYDFAARIVDGIKAGKSKEDILKEDYLYAGFKIKVDDDQPKPFIGSNPYIDNVIDAIFNYKSKSHALLVNSISVTKLNVDEYDKPIKEQALKNIHKSKDRSDNYNIFQTFYSATDTYLVGTMEPLFNVYAPLFQLEGTIQKGDGNSDSVLVDKIDSLSKCPDCFLLNIVKTVNANLYINKIKQKFPDEWKKTPIIFYNRQPTKNDGTVDEDIMNNPENPFIYYIGFDAQEGGELQGELVFDYLEALVNIKYWDEHK